MRRTHEWRGGVRAASAIPRQPPPRAAAVHFPQKENLPLAADGRHADAIPVVRDAAHHAGETRAVPLVLLGVAVGAFAQLR